jgi:cbb3-type cytochrome oxidase maturation protein
MIILLMLIPLSLVLLAAAIGAFVWAVRKGQFDDMDTPALDILHDDPEIERRQPSVHDHVD